MVCGTSISAPAAIVTDDSFVPASCPNRSYKVVSTFTSFDLSDSFATLVWIETVVEFRDGVYRDATVYLNGHKLGVHPYGYTGFTFDLTSELNFKGPNVLAVRVDNSAQPNSRWYSGSGIYRHVRVVVTDPTHVAHWGVFITTPTVSENSATVSIQTKVANESDKSKEVKVETTFMTDWDTRQAQRNHP